MEKLRPVKLKKKLKMNNRFIVCILSLLPFLALPGYAQVKAEEDSTRIPSKNQPYIAIKTNMLYDAILVPNIGIEGRVYKNCTVYADVMYAGWEMPKKHFYWDLYGAQCGARTYFGSASMERSFTGHHAGVYAQAMAYDLQNGNIGQQAISLHIGGGVEYGYALPIGRNLNIDFELGVGYIGGLYDEYVVQDTHNTWRATIKRNWIGPTKASISLMWLIKPSTKSVKR